MTFNVVVRKNPAFRLRVLPRVIPVSGGGNVTSVNGDSGPVVVLDADDISDASTAHKFATAEQLSAAESAVQPDDLAAVATSGAYSDLSGTPTLGALAAKDQAEIADIDATGTPSGTTYLRGDGTWSTPAGSGTGVVETIVAGTGISVDATDPANPIVSATGGGGSGDMTAAVYDPQNIATDAFDTDNHTDGSTNGVYTLAERSKLAGIEANADVTNATNVAAAGAVMESDTSTASMSFVIDEDDMASDSDEKVPTQQSVNRAKIHKAADQSALEAIVGAAQDVVFIKATAEQSHWIWSSADQSTAISAADPRYVAPSSDPDGSSGAFILAGSVETGSFTVTDGARIHRLADRVFIGGMAGFNGIFDNPENLSGISDLTKALHSWAPRSATLLVDSTAGSMSIVGHSQSTKATGSPGYPTYTPASIGVSGFAINDAEDGQAWGGYFDAVKLPGANFTVAVEHAIANFDDVTTITPFNYLTGGADAGAAQWVQSGCGLDLVESSLALEGLSPWDVNQAAAGTVYLSSYAHGSPTDWAASTAYSVGDQRIDANTDVVYRCMVAHTSGGTTFSADRAANPTYWKARPGFRKGIVFTAGSLAELSAGANIFAAIEMTERSQISWYRKNASNVAEQAAFIWAENIPDGSSAVGITFQQNLVSVTASNGVRADRFRSGSGSDIAEIYRQSGTNGLMVFDVTGSGGFYFSKSLSFASGATIFTNGVQVLGARRTGWAAATGTATRTTFATGSVTLPVLAEHVKALIDDLTTHGLIGA